MNKKEKEAVCEMLAQWEWGQFAHETTTSASSRSGCIENVKEVLKIAEDDEELMFARQYILYTRSKHEDDPEDYWDYVIWFMERRTYEDVIQFVEEHGFDGLRKEAFAEGCSD